MEKAFITNQLNIARKCKNLDVLYFGDEFCEYKIPSLTQLKSIYKLANKNKIKFVLVLPYITNKSLESITLLLHYLNNLNKKIEIVFNDWGTFTMISQYNNLQPILGRLLNKQRKDPIANDIITNKQDKMKMIVENNEKILVQSKKVPLTLKKYFQKSFLDVPSVMNFMILNNIKRYELDLLPWGNKLKIDKKIKISIYYPYVDISITRYCGAINLDYSSKCNAICQNQRIEIGTGVLKYPYTIIGNVVFYKTDIKMLQKELKNSRIDRIVFNDIDALKQFKD